MPLSVIIIIKYIPKQYQYFQENSKILKLPSCLNLTILRITIKGLLPLPSWRAVNYNYEKVTRLYTLFMWLLTQLWKYEKFFDTHIEASTTDTVIIPFKII